MCKNVEFHACFSSHFSDVMIKHVVPNKIPCVSQSAQFVALLNPFVEQKPSSPCLCYYGWHFPQQYPFKKCRCKQCPPELQNRPPSSSLLNVLISATTLELNQSACSVMSDRHLWMKNASNPRKSVLLNLFLSQLKHYQERLHFLIISAFKLALLGLTLTSVLLGLSE